MVNLSVFSGAPVLVIIYTINLFLTNFGLNLYPAFAIFLVYGSFYIISRLNSGHGLNPRNKNLFLLHFVLLAYGLLMFYFFEMGVLSRESNGWWSLASFVKFLSIIIASIAVILTPIERITKSISIIKNVSYIMVFGALWYYLTTPLGLNFLASDELAGYRYNGGIDSYIVAGQFLIAGFVGHMLFNQEAKPTKLLIAIACFGFAIIATKDRTSIVSMLIILAILFYRSAFGISPFNFQFRKTIVLLILIPLISFFAISQYQNFLTGNLDAYKSAFNRLTISIRSYEIFRDVFPIGSGPGSQTFLMTKQETNADFLDQEEEGISSIISDEIKSMNVYVGTDYKLSPHNTYVDFLIPFGALGLFFVFCVLRVQIGSIKRLLFDRDNPRVILESFAVLGLLFLMFSSLFNLWWLYLIYYRMLISRQVRV